MAILTMEPISIITGREKRPKHLLAIVATLAEGERQAQAYGESFSVTIATSLAEGLDRFYEICPAVVTLDTQGYIDGPVWPLFATLQASPPYPTTAMCFITDDGRLTQKVAAFQAGADHYLMRNLDPTRQCCALLIALHLVRTRRRVFDTVQVK